MVYIGLDIGGTKFMAAAADENGQILARTRRPSPVDLQEGLSLLNEMISEVAAGRKILGMGAAIGGPLDWQSGLVSPLHQPAWRNIPLKEIMQTRWECPFWVDVDTNIAALAEYNLGRVHPARMMYLTISTGIGGGFLIDGKIYRGMNGAHPEVAHQTIAYRCSNPVDVFCECGVPDCLEALVSGNGIRRIYHKPAEQLSDLEWAEVAYNLGQGLRNIAVIYAPDVIVLGGGVAVGAGQSFISLAAQVMRDHMRLVPPPEVRLSSLGYDTALLGAVVIAQKGLV